MQHKSGTQPADVGEQIASEVLATLPPGVPGPAVARLGHSRAPVSLMAHQYIKNKYLRSGRVEGVEAGWCIQSGDRDGVKVVN